ncbi:MAG: hypothetical protein J6C05_03845 [Prevotella sp.]|nr:hypothetical protein [Prevotella sp.]
MTTDEQEMHDTPIGRARQREERRREERLHKIKMIRNILNLIFMLMAIAGMAYYFFADKYVGTIIILVAMAFKMVESSMRMLKI